MLEVLLNSVWQLTRSWICLSKSPSDQDKFVEADVTLYRVATSLNRLMFDSPKANDTLLLMTILSTDLKSLKRRGYNGESEIDRGRIRLNEMVTVDRIIRQQKETRLAAEAELKKSREPGPTLPGSFNTPVDLDHLHDHKSSPPPVPEKPITSAFTNPFMNLRKKIGMTGTSNHPDHLEAERKPPLPHDSRPGSPPNHLPGSVPGGFPNPSQPHHRSNDGEVTPKSNICM